VPIRKLRQALQVLPDRQGVPFKPKSICQTSPRFTFGIGRFPSVQSPRPFSGDGHHFLIAYQIRAGVVLLGILASPD